MAIFKLTEYHRQLAVKILVGGLFVSLGWFLAARPAVMKIQSIQRTTAEARERSQLVLDIHRFEKKKKVFEGQLTEEAGRHAILGKLTTLAGDHGLDVKSLTPSVESEPQYSRLTLTLNARASFSALVNFLAAAEKLEPPVAVRELKAINQLGYYRRGDARGDLPEVELNLETYLKKSKVS